MRTTKIQTNFTSGELDPRVTSRIDVAQYYNGAERLRNVVINPLGGAVRAPGMQHIDVLKPLRLALAAAITPTAPNGGTAANAADDDINTLLTTTGAIGTTNPYVVAHYDLGAAVAVASAEIIGASIDVPTTSAGNTGRRNPNTVDNDASIGRRSWRSGDINKVKSRDGSEARSSEMGPSEETHYLRCTNYSFAALIPVDAVITGVIARIRRRTRVGDNGIETLNDHRVRLVVRGVIVGDNKASGDTWPLTLGDKTYGGASDLWGWPLTREDITRSDFGLALSVESGADGFIGDARVDSVELTVHYTTAAIASPDEFAIQYSTDNMAWTTYGTPFAVRDNDEVSFRHLELITARYWRYARVGATDLDTAVASIRSFNVSPDEVGDDASLGLSDCAFVDFDFSLDQRYMIVFTDRNAAVYENGVFQVDVPSPYTSEQLSQLSFDQKLDTVALFHPDVQPQLMQRQGAADKWVLKSMQFDYIPKHAFELITSNPAQTLTPSTTNGSITLTAGGSVFEATDVGQYVNGNGGRARIYKYTSGTVVLARVEIPFLDANAIASGSWTLERGYEDAWSVTRGWPNCGLFYQNRLWIGGSRSRPDTVNGSRLGQYFDFNLGRADADDAIEYTIENSDVAGILSINASRHLQFFTKTAEFYVPQSENQALTPASFNVRKADEVGSKIGSNVVNVGGSAAFIQAEGQSIQKFNLSTGIEDTGQAFSIYSAEDITTLSSHLIRNPVQLAFRKATSTNDPNLLMAVNGDGTLAICTILHKEGVQAWTLRETQGLVKRIGVLGSEVYLMVERTINGTAVRFIERLNNNCRLDGCVLVNVDADTGSVAYLEELFENEEVQIILDGALQNPQTVQYGAITFDRDAEETYQIGFGYDPLVRPMPMARDPDGGENLSGKKRVFEVLVMLYETSWLEINGQPVGLQQFGPGILDQTLQPFTGRKTVDGILGWTEEGQFDITQGNIPATMTLTGIEMQVSV
jgi:hypothetical protein